MAVSPVILPTSGHAAWDDLATWWLSRYKVSTQQTYATYLPRWTAWCTRHGIDPLDARRADAQRWLQTIADSGLSRASVAGHYERWPASTGWRRRRTSLPSIPAPASADRRCTASCSAARC